MELDEAGPVGAYFPIWKSTILSGRQPFQMSDLIPSGSSTTKLTWDCITRRKARSDNRLRELSIDGVVTLPMFQTSIPALLPTTKHGRDPSFGIQICF